jgi:hypothetical protein
MTQFTKPENQLYPKRPGFENQMQLLVVYFAENGIHHDDKSSSSNRHQIMETRCTYRA